MILQYRVHASLKQVVPSPIQTLKRRRGRNTHYLRKDFVRMCLHAQDSSLTCYANKFHIVVSAVSAIPTLKKVAGVRSYFVTDMHCQQEIGGAE